MWVPFEKIGQHFANPGFKLFKLTQSLLHVPSKRLLKIHQSSHNFGQSSLKFKFSWQIFAISGLHKMQPNPHLFSRRAPRTLDEYLQSQSRAVGILN